MWAGLTATDIGKDSGVSEEKDKKPDDKQQSKLFIEKAREIGADEEKSAADDLMKELASTAPEPRSNQKTSAKRRSKP
jgi:hypothetical protein